MGHDLRFALRRLARRPLHAAVVTLTLALGIGATLAVFAVVDATLLRPLPYPDADRLLRVAQRIPIASMPEVRFSDMGYQRLARENRTLSAVAAYRVYGANVATRQAPLRAPVLRATASLFD